MAAGDLGDRGAGALGAGERDALHARVGDDLLDLVVRGVDVHVGAGREARVEEDLLDRGGGLGAQLGVLEQDRVADHEVRAGEASDLVVREVPRHDAEQHPERRAADDRRAIAREELDRLVLEEVRRVVGVVLVDRRGEVGLAERLRDRLAHLAHDELRQLLAALGVQFADAADEGRALLDRGRLRPGAVRLVGRGDRGLELGVGDGVVGLDRLAGGGVGYGIVHRVCLLVCGLAQSCDRFVGRYDIGEFVVEARETRAVDQVGGEDLSVGSFPIEGRTRIADDPRLESEVARHPRRG